MNINHLLIGSLTLLLMPFAGIVYFIYALFVPVKTLEITNFSYAYPIPLETPVVHPGDTIRYELDYCKYIDSSPITHRTLVDGQIITLTSSAGNLPMGCHQTERDVMIPETINPGKYYLNVEIDYQVNPVRTESTHYYTDYFQVVPKRVATSTVPVVATSSIPTPPPGGVD